MSSDEKVTLYKPSKNGMRFWAIEADYELEQLVITHGLVNGATQQKFEDVEENLSGRTIEEQIQLRMDTRIRNKKDIGYRETKEAAKKDEGQNTLGFFRPMLAKRHDQLKRIEWQHLYMQMKYDGHRCMITRTADGIVVYSRKGRPITTINHITDSMKIPLGVTIDGELYHHGTSLQRIGSWVKKKQSGTLNLEFIAYDIVLTNATYAERYFRLKNMDLGNCSSIAPTEKKFNPAHLQMHLDTAISIGYEGLILRDSRLPYEIGTRSKGLIKVKQFMDDEFTVVGFKQSEDGWAILVCDVGNGETVDASAPGTHEDKHDVWKNQDKFMGKKVTLKFANYTEDGIPFHPVAERWYDEL